MNNWNVNSPDKKTVLRLMSGLQITPLAAAALAAKGYTSPEDAVSNLNTSSLSDPFLIKDMAAAADILNAAVDSCEKICVYGDFDCDGIMATTILYSFLLEAGADVMYYIPERSEGYGLNNAAIDKLADEGVQLIITVDNGISAVSEADHIYERGMRLVITDHHQPGETIPRAEAVVDPHQKDDMSPFKYACGAVVALKLVAAMDGGDYTLALEQYSDLAAIATVADVVSLTGENRYIVSLGLERITNTDRPALIALKAVSGAEGKPADSFTLGFVLGPRINASGRAGSPTLALRLFLSEDMEECQQLARQLNDLNTRRKSTESDILASIYDMIDSDPGLVQGRVIFICGSGWHHGVIGIVASKIEEQFGKPVFLASEGGGEVRGSARAFGEFSVFGALTYASDALEKFGGHPGAGGFTIKPGCTERFRHLLEEYAAKNHPAMPRFTISADYAPAPGEITVDNIRDLQLLAPFGQGNEEPLFYLENAEILSIDGMSGGVHSRIRLKYGNITTSAVMWHTSPEELPTGLSRFCDLIVTLGIEDFAWKSSSAPQTPQPKFYIKDIRPHGFDQGRYFAAKAAYECFCRNEKLPGNYYPTMLPDRQDVVRLYKSIPSGGINSDALYCAMADRSFNYCRFSVAAQALRELGHITISSGSSRIARVENSPKSALESAPVLARLRSHLPESSR